MCFANTYAKTSVPCLLSEMKTEAYWILLQIRMYNVHKHNNYVHMLYGTMFCLGSQLGALSLSLSLSLSLPLSLCLCLSLSHSLPPSPPFLPLNSLFCLRSLALSLSAGCLVPEHSYKSSCAAHGGHQTAGERAEGEPYTSENEIEQKS